MNKKIPSPRKKLSSEATKIIITPGPDNKLRTPRPARCTKTRSSPKNKYIPYIPVQSTARRDKTEKFTITMTKSRRRRTKAPRLRICRNKARMQRLSLSFSPGAHTHTYMHRRALVLAQRALPSIGRTLLSLSLSTGGSHCAACAHTDPLHV